MQHPLYTNPAWLKLDLYCKGIRIPAESPVYSDNLSKKKARPILRTRAGLGSGLEVILPQNLWTNIPVSEPFTKHSPYELIFENEIFRIRHRDGFEIPVTLPQRPAWYEQHTQSGKRMDRVGTLQGTYLGIYPASVCEYWTESPRSNCRFCSVGLNLGADDADTKTVDEVLEVIHAARAESKITYVDFNTGHYIGETYLDILEPMIRRIKAETDLLVGIQTPPHHDLSRYDRLQAMGVNRVSFCFEIFDPTIFQEICPGKSREYGLKRYLDTIEYCAKLSRKSSWKNPWVTNGEIIAGLEPPESSIQAIDWLTERGAIPTVCVFRPLLGTDMKDHSPPETETLLPVFRHLFEACMKHHLPIGLAPNIHVSLVLLPDESRFLSPHYRFAEQWRKLQAKVFATQYYLRRNLFFK